MPAKPQILFYVYDLMKLFPLGLKGYLESAVSILGRRSNSEEGWFPLTMPVSDYLPLWTGLLLGYPKYKPQAITLEEVDGKWVGRVTHRNRAPLALEFTPVDVHVPWQDAYGFFEPFFTPSKKGGINLMESYVPETVYRENSGNIELTVDSEEPWTRLLPGTKVTAPGLFFSFQGKSYLTRRELKPI
jgi:hypothetical protein